MVAREQGFDIATAAVGGIQDAKRQLSRRPFDVLLTDWRLGSDDGLDLVRESCKRHPDTTVLVMTGNYATPDTAVEFSERSAPARSRRRRRSLLTGCNAP